MNEGKAILKMAWADKKLAKQHLIRWLILYAIFCGINLSVNGLAYNSAYIDITLVTFSIALLFYANYFFCELFLTSKKKYFFISYLFLFLVYTVLLHLLAISQYNKYNRINTKIDHGSFLIYQFLLSTFYFILITAISTTIWSVKNAADKKIESDRKQQELSLQNAYLEEQKLHLQKELLQSENNFLRAQINPHFLYNSLNFLYAKTFQQQPQVAETIMMLSQIMRYSLSDFSSTNGLAKLQDEINHIENLIKINSVRFDNSLQIQFNVNGDTANKFIAPMLFITLVENIFKHGDLQDVNSPAIICCTVNIISKQIEFTTFNKKDKLTVNSSSNLGLTNIRQRLKILYQENFVLATKYHEPFFSAKLVIPYFDNYTN